MCPYLVPVVADRLWQVPLPGYCRRPDTRIRIPARTTMLAVCTTGRFAECAGYRGAAADGTVPGRARPGV